MKPAITISLVPEARGGPFVFWDGLASGCAKAALHGFAAVEVFPPSASELDARELRDLLQQHGLRVAALGTGAGWVKHKLRLTDPDASIRKRAVDFIRSMAERAAEFDAPAIVGSMQGRWGDGVSRELALDWLAEGLADVRRASAAATPLLYEPLNRYETNLFNLIGDAADFLQQRGLTGVNLLCDLFHMAIEERDLGAALRAAGPRVGHIHLADSNRHAAGFGHTDFAPVLHALRDISYGGFLSAEILPLPDPDSAAAQTIRFLRAHQIT